MKSYSTVQRRTFLRGAGVAMALPWLESLPAWGRSPERTPTRFAFFFMGNGVHNEHWTAEQERGTIQLGKTLAPLAPLAEDAMIIKGLFHENAGGNSRRQVAPHGTTVPLLLSGFRPKGMSKNDKTVKAATTIDQLIARHVGKRTPLGSLALGTEQTHLRNDGIYASHVSWSSPTSPVPKEIRPAQTFDLLFSKGSDQRDKSVLDLVLADAQSLQVKLSNDDRQRLDEYMTSVRELEKRIDQTSHDAQRAIPTDVNKTTQRPKPGIPADPDEHMRQMLDILVLALRMDQTRVATMVMTMDWSQRSFPKLGITTPNHSLSHKNSDEFQRANQWHIEQLAYLGEKLKSVQEGERTLLDNSLVLFASNFWTGKDHDVNQVPTLLLGRGGGTLRTGRVLDYVGRTDEDRRYCSLLLSIADCMGLHLDRFGDTDRRLDELQP